MAKGKHFAALLKGQWPEGLALKITGIHQKTVQRWIDGQCLPHKRMLPVIALAAGLSLQQVQEAYKADRTQRKARKRA